VRTDRLEKEYGVQLRWSVFPLHPETPEEGMELSELFAGREEHIKAMQARLRQLAAVEGLPLAERTRTCNSRRAQGTGVKWGGRAGKGDLFRKAVYHAYFVDGVNIAKTEALVRIAEGVGLPGNEAQSVLTIGSFASAVDADWQRARQLGVTAVPTHICEGRWLEGFGAYADFLRLVGQG